MEKNLKKQIVKAASAVKRKVEIIKDAKNTNNMALETIFKPLTDPLKLIANKNNTVVHGEEQDHNHRQKKNKNSENEDNYLSSESSDANISEEEPNSENEFYEKSNKTLIDEHESHNISDDSFKSLQSSPSIKNQSISWSTSSEIMKDIPFGIRHERGKLMLGKVRVFDNGSILKIGNRSFKKTVGLKELLFKKTPNIDLLSQEDLQNYKLILMDTNAHRRNYDPSKPINSNKGFKYMHIIKPLFKFSRNVTTSTESLPEGKGINILKRVKKKH